MDAVTQYINFDNVVSVIYMLFTGVSVVLAMKLKTENIIANYKLKKAENERDEAHAALDQVSQTLVNFGDTLNLVAQGSKLTPTEKIVITSTWAKQREVVATVGTLVQPVLNLLKDEAKDMIEEGQDGVLPLIMDLGQSVLEKYANPDKDPEV